MHKCAVLLMHMHMDRLCIYCLGTRSVPAKSHAFSKLCIYTVMHLDRFNCILFNPGGSSNVTESPSTCKNSPSKRRKFDPFITSITPSIPENNHIDPTAGDTGVEQLQDSSMYNPPPESFKALSLFTQPSTSSIGAQTLLKKRGKHKATNLNL